VPARRQKSLSELGAQKQTIRRLNERLQLADVPSDDDEDDDDKDSSDATAVVDTVTAPPPEDDDDYDDYASLKKPKRKHTPAAATAASTPTPVTASTPAATATVDEPVSTLRKRTEKTVGEMRSELFGATATGAKRKGRQPSEVAGTEAVLDEQRLEQENITEDLLQMAKLLKESSVTFGASLESEKAYLEAAREGLDRNTSGMQTAGKNIDNLRKNDNVSFLWTMIYLAIIVALVNSKPALACGMAVLTIPQVFLTLFILFFAPKLRWW
jgi:hypothetical protein